MGQAFGAVFWTCMVLYALAVAAQIFGHVFHRSRYLSIAQGCVSVGLEILKTPDQAMLDRLDHGLPEQVDETIESLGPGRRHKALWDQYRPLLRFAVSAGLPLVAMDPSRPSGDTSSTQRPRRSSIGKCFWS